MAFLQFPRDLPGLTPEITRRPKHANDIQPHISGGEVRFGYWSEPLWEWDIAYQALRDGFRNGAAFDELRQVLGLFLATSGALQGFQFFDVDDNRVYRQYIGTTDGISSAYTLTRTYGANDPAYGWQGTETVGFVDLNPQDLIEEQAPFALYIGSGTTQYLPGNSDPTYGYTLAMGAPKQQQIVFNSAPAAGHALYVDMSYLFYVRFGADSQDFDKFMAQLWSLKKTTLVSLRFGSGGSSLPASTSQAAGRSVVVNSSPFVITNADGYVGITNNTGAPLELDLPLYPSANQVVKLADEGSNAGTYNWTINWNGSVVDTIVVNRGFTSLRWSGFAWYQIGAQ